MSHSHLPLRRSTSSNLSWQPYVRGNEQVASGYITGGGTSNPRKAGIYRHPGSACAGSQGVYAAADDDSVAKSHAPFT